MNWSSDISVDLTLHNNILTVKDAQLLEASYTSLETFNQYRAHLNEVVMYEHIRLGDNISCEYKEDFNAESTIELSYDGRYKYSRIYIHKLDYYIMNGVISISDNNLFYYNSEVYKVKSDYGSVLILDSAQDALNVSDKIDILDLYELVNANDADDLNVRVLYEVDFISINNIQKCLLKYQYENIVSNKKFCIFADECASKAQRDFLLASVYILDHLIDTKDFDTAEHILNALNSCNSLCEQVSNDCGCGKNI